MIYHLFERVIAFILFIFCLPLLAILYFLVKRDSPGPFLFVQQRAGKGKKPFWIYKIRTMVNGAESLKPKVQKLNEIDGPVFKIRNDPRFTRIGKLLSHTALDEIPQLINIVQGTMTFVGPRPLPLNEAQNVPLAYVKRFTVLPGITSSWIVRGAHTLSFREWMRLDCQYVQKKTPLLDLQIIIQTSFLVVRFIIHYLTK